MGRSRKRFNEKARQAQSNEVFRAEKEEVEIDIQIQEEKYDSNNPLVICNKKKNKTKGPAKEIPVVKPLSRKQKKKLANILARKKKKLNRAELLEKLSKVQAKPEDLNFLTSTASMQTHGVKKLIQENSVEKDSAHLKISNIKGSRKKNVLPPKQKIKLHPNVVGFESSSSDTDGEVPEMEETKDETSFDTTNVTFVSSNDSQETDLVDFNSDEESALNVVSGRTNKNNRESNITELDYSLQKTTENSSSGQTPEILHPVNQDVEVQEDAVDDTENDLLICEGEKNKLEEASPSKPLSKKQMKKLKSILAKKGKKLDKEVLLKKLRKLQVDVEDINSLMSITSVQTLGTKRLFQDDSTCTSTNIKRKKKKIAQYSNNELQLDGSFVGIECNSPEIDDEETKDNEVENLYSADNSDTQEISVGSSVMDNQRTKENSLCDVTDSANNENIVAKEIHSSEKSSEESAEQTVTDKLKRSPAVFVPLNRLPEIQAARVALPIFCEEQAIMEAIRENSVVVIHGETGSGKTTQVPQFLYEGGYAQNKKIAVTEPRRIAAMTMAARVGKEMNLPDVVSYHVRYDNNVTEETKITFMTDGVLLKEFRSDFYLSDYSVVIVDESHERSVFSDVLIGLLSRIVPVREKKGNPLKLVIMSATMRVEEFTENPRLFKEPPFLIQLDSRQYKVDVHFNIHTPIDYVEAAYHKVCKIHTQLPAGAILVFLTGEKEVTKLCKMLRNTYPFKDNANYTSESIDIKDSNPESSNYSRRKKKKQEKNNTSFCSLPQIDLDDYAAEPLDTENMQHQLSDDEQDSHIDSFHPSKQEDFIPLYTLPLYSILPFHEQEKVFQPPPPGSRLCVVSTNVAETSITIPGLKYVVDSGKVKTKVYNTFAGGISQFCIEWTSKASANQRAGRAGRTEGGHCYRLYSSSVFQHEFPDFSPPEIQRIPVDDVLLQMKALGIVTVVNFPFPSPPDPETLKSAERRLVLLGALEDLNKDERYKDMKKWEYSAKITQLGSAMARFPLSPRYAKMLVLSYKHQCIPYIVAIVSAMTVPELFQSSDGVDNDNSEQKLLWKGIKDKAGHGKLLEFGDIMVLLRAVALYEESRNKVQFCIKNRIRHKAMVEIHKMCLQLRREMNRTFKDLDLPLELKIEPPNEEQIEKLRKILTTGFTDHVARLLPEEEMKLNKDLKNAYKCLDLEDPVFIHPSSVLFSELPRYIIYQEIVHTSKYYMKGIVEINPEWLPAFAPSMCEFSDPLEEPAPNYDSEKDQILCSVNVTFGPWKWELPAIIKEMPKSPLKYTWFSFFLLDGQIYNFFKHYKKHVLSSPATLLKSWAKSLPRTRYLLQALYDKNVDSKESLEKIWNKEPKFLLREYWEWLPQEKHMEVECKWPPKS